MMAFTLVIALAACAPPAAPTATPAALAASTAPAAAEPAAPAISKASWEIEWENAISAARREGKIVVISTAGTTVRDAILQGFKARYGIGVEFISGRGGDVAEKLMSERRAGLYQMDVYMGGTTTTLNTLKPAGALESAEPILILPEVKDPKAWLGEKGPIYVDKDHTVLAFVMYLAPPVTINQNVLKAADVPKSHFDLLSPRWKGKIAMFDPAAAGIGLRWTGAILGGHLPPLNADYMRQLAKQEPVITGDHRLLGEWIAREKYHIAMNLRSDVTLSFQQVGVPLKEIMLSEGTVGTSGSGNLALINRAPHPNAAKVFVNWMLTKDGQLLFSKAMDFPSARLDVSTSHIDPVKVPDPKGGWYMSENEDFLFKQPTWGKLAAEIFATSIK